MRPVESFIAQPVRSLQTMLRVIREDAGYTDNVIPDGIYGTTTAQAVSQFQRDHGFPVTGVTDLNTWEAIAREYRPAWTRIGPAEPLQVILNPNQVLKSGDEHPYLYLIQAMLTTLAHIYGSIPAPKITGVLDFSTGEAVTAFQYLSGLPQSGNVDKVTWKHLMLQYPLAVNRRYSQNKIRR